MPCLAFYSACSCGPWLPGGEVRRPPTRARRATGRSSPRSARPPTSTRPPMPVLGPSKDNLPRAAASCAPDRRASTSEWSGATTSSIRPPSTRPGGGREPSASTWWSGRGDAGKPTCTGEAGCCSSCPPRISWGSSDGSTVPATWTARSTLGDSSSPTVWNATARRFRSARSPARRGTLATTCSGSPVRNVMGTGAPTCGMRRLIPHVGAPVPMTFLTGDPEHVVARVPRRAGDRADRKRRAVAFQTVGDDESPKVDLAVHVAGTVDPSLDPHEIRGGQLEQQPASPVQVGLPASPRPDHQVDALGSRPPPGRVDGGLIEDVVA